MTGSKGVNLSEELRREAIESKVPGGNAFRHLVLCAEDEPFTLLRELRQGFAYLFGAGKKRQALFLDPLPFQNFQEGLEVSILPAVDLLHLHNVPVSWSGPKAIGVASCSLTNALSPPPPLTPPAKGGERWGRFTRLRRARVGVEGGDQYLLSRVLSWGLAASLMSLLFSLLFHSLFFALAPTIYLPFAFYLLMLGHSNLHSFKEYSRQNTVVTTSNANSLNNDFF